MEGCSTVKEATRELIRVAIWILLISVSSYIILDDQVSDRLEHWLGW